LPALDLALATFVGLLPIANPFSTAVVFLAITPHLSEERKRSQAKMAAVYMTAILLVFLLAGAYIMSFFGISLPGVRIAGGLIVSRIGFAMLDPHEDEKDLEPEEKDEALTMKDLAFTPLAMPMLSGPGAIAMTLSMATEAGAPGEFLGIGIGIFMVAVVSWLVLRESRRVVRVMGPTGINAMSRIMGFLLVAVGVQFFVLGVAGFVVDPDFIHGLLDVVNEGR
jgi:multiple antibiotic resistance protein